MKTTFLERHFFAFRILAYFWKSQGDFGDWVDAQLALSQEAFEEAYGPRHVGVRYLMEMYAAW